MKRKTQNIIVISYLLVLLVSLFIFLQVREWIDYHLVTSFSFYESFYSLAAFVFSIIGTAVTGTVYLEEKK